MKKLCLADRSRAWKKLFLFDRSRIEKPEDVFVRPESNGEKAVFARLESSGCEQSEAVCFRSKSNEHEPFGTVLHEAERLESTGTGACFGPSDRQLRVEAKSSRKGPGRR